MRVAPVVEFSESDKAWLVRESRSRIAPKRLGERCQIVLLAAQSKTNQQIAAALGISRQKAGRWRMHFVQKGHRGIEEEERGRKPIYLQPLRELLVHKTTRGHSAARCARVEPHLHGQGDETQAEHRGTHLAPVRAQASSGADL